MSTLAVLVIVALCSAPVLLAQEDITDICDYPCVLITTRRPSIGLLFSRCTQEIFNEQCGGAVCPLPKSPSQDELDAICSLNCLSALEFGNVSGCIADVDVWRPDIDGDARGMAADIRSAVYSTEPLVEA